ncbi:MAG: hypothetical protein ACOH1Y_08280 [Propionicimonas sp.]
MNIRALISPLRYDVVVRADFFIFLKARLSEGARRAEDFGEAALDQPYFVWFRQVAMARFRPWVLEDEDLLHQQFTERVQASIDLWVSFGQNGFDLAHPVTLRAGSGPMPTDSGAVIDRRLHVGDGGHRLALLLANGVEELGPGMYRVDPRPMAQLIDNTAVLLPAIPVSVGDYVRFLAHGFASRGGQGSPDNLTLETLIEDVRQNRSGQLGELERLLNVHRMLSKPSA